MINEIRITNVCVYIYKKKLTIFSSKREKRLKKTANNSLNKHIYLKNHMFSLSAICASSSSERENVWY